MRLVGRAGVRLLDVSSSNPRIKRIALCFYVIQFLCDLLLNVNSSKFCSLFSLAQGISVQLVVIQSLYFLYGSVYHPIK